MPCTLLDPATTIAMPWKNGGGTTLQLAISPKGARLEDFAWRLSSAQVAVDGAFSSFPGADRSLAVLAGNGLRLRRGDGSSEELLSGGMAAYFPGEEPIEATLLDGPVNDLNLMTRRTAWRHRLAPLPVQGQRTLDNDAALLLLWCQRGTAIACRLPSGERRQLDSGQGLLLEDEPGLLELHAQQSALLYVAWLYRQG